MKILLVHNNYGKYSGEEAVVDKMTTMLQNHGHEICSYRKTTENIRESLLGKIKGFLSGIYSPTGVKKMSEILKKEKPDVINIHNLYPFISPAALFECKKAGVPVIMTIHNFRLICPTGLFMRDGRPCETCLEKGHEWSCIKYNCEHSVPKSFGYTLRNVYARWTKAYKENIDTFACITEFQKKKLIEAGYEANRIRVIPNSVDAPNECLYHKGEYVAFCGRLSKEKGVDFILDIAKRHPEIPFKLAGELRDEELIKDGIPDNCQLMGYLSRAQLNNFYQKSAFAIMASKCYEGFPMSILEAAQFGKCTIGPDHGGFTEIIGKGENAIGRLFKPNHIDDLEKQIIDLWNHQESTEALGKKAFEKLKKQYDSEVIYKQWERLIMQIKNGPNE